MSEATATGARPTADRIAALEQAAARLPISPELCSGLAVGLEFTAAGLLAAGQFRGAGLVLAAAAAVDWLDGVIANRKGDAFSLFLDAALDCYGDLGLFVGLVVYYARVNRFLYAGLVCVALAGSVMIGYARARSASLVAHGAHQPVEGLEGGFWERPERLGLMLVGALADRMAPVLWLLAIGPNLSLLMTVLRARGHLRRLLERIGPIASPG